MKRSTKQCIELDQLEPSSARCHHKLLATSSHLRTKVGSFSSSSDKYVAKSQAETLLLMKPIIVFVDFAR
jgi:hypothetical protein